MEGRRTEERLYSYDDQAKAIAADCERDGVRLLRVGRERNVSGGADLAGRPELSKAVEDVEAGKAEMIVVAYFDRFFRSLAVQNQVIERIEAAGGELLALDHGRLTNGTAAQRLNSNMMGAVAQFYREQSGEKAREGQASALARGAVPWARVQLGYSRQDDGTFVVDPHTKPIVREAFEMRDRGASIPEIRAMLKSHGIDRSQRGIQVMLASRVYLGEIHFGDLVNANAHPPIIERDLWERVQRRKTPRGPRPKSTRLLARLGLLRCASCGSRLSAAKLPKQNDYPIYRCASSNDCPKHVTISAEAVEALVMERTRERLEGTAGCRAPQANIRAAKAELERAQDALSSAVRALRDFTDEESVVQRLRELRDERDRARERLDEMGDPDDATILLLDDDWDELSRDEQRQAIRATFREIRVHPAARRRAPIPERVEFVPWDGAMVLTGKTPDLPLRP